MINILMCKHQNLLSFKLKLYITLFVLRGFIYFVYFFFLQKFYTNYILLYSQ